MRPTKLDPPTWTKMTSPTLHQSGKSKRHSRGAANSPSPGKFEGARWVPLPGTAHCMVPSHRCSYLQQQQQPNINHVISLLGIEKEVLDTISGARGVVDMKGLTLYSSWMQLASLDISTHLPVRGDSILLNPETMKVIAVAIACPVVVSRGWFRGVGQREEGEEGGEKEPVYVCCKAWPLASMPLDVVALGWSAVQGCGMCEGEGVEVRPVTRPVSKIPVAGQVVVAAMMNYDFPMDRTFRNYFLHMHDGHLVTAHSCIGVHYLGERRVFKVVDLKPLDEGSCNLSNSSLSLIKQVEKNVSKLSLNEALMEETPKGELDSMEAFNTSFVIYKITVKSQLIVVSQSSRVRSPDGRSRPSPDELCFAGVGGLKKQKQLLRELVLHPLSTQVHHKAVMFPRGLILHGPAGVGKTLLALALAKAADICVQVYHARQLLAQDCEANLQLAFSKARINSPSLLVLDDLDVLCPMRDTTLSEAELRGVACLSALMDGLCRDPSPAHVVVVATTHQLERVELSLRSPGRFEKELEVPVPTSCDRLEILEVLLQGRPHMLSHFQLKSVADKAHGYVGADLYAVCSEAQYNALHRSLVREGEGDKGFEGGQDEGVVSVTLADMLCALKEVRPSAMREIILEVPKVYWADVGGNDEVKQSMKEAVEWPLKHPGAFVRLGIRPPRGVLLYGPPGCSKTMVARALATESGLNFLAVKGPELFSKWVGDSEKAVRQIFKKARTAAPAIIFFDEIDALAVKRKGEGSSVGDRVLAQLLTEMDGVESAGDVLIVAATNRPDMIDKALLRPGRMDRLIYVPLPSDLTRREILQIQLRHIPVHDDVSLDHLVARTTRYSGAEVVSLCQKAALCAMQEDIETSCVYPRHFERALISIIPQTDLNTLTFYEDFKNKL